MNVFHKGSWRIWAVSSILVLFSRQVFAQNYGANKCVSIWTNSDEPPTASVSPQPAACVSDTMTFNVLVNPPVRKWTDTVPCQGSSRADDVGSVNASWTWSVSGNTAPNPATGNGDSASFANAAPGNGTVTFYSSGTYTLGGHTCTFTPPSVSESFVVQNKSTGVFDPQSATVVKVSPSRPLDSSLWGLTMPEGVTVGLSAYLCGGKWYAELTSLVGNYSKQAALPAGVQEVTGPAGNTTAMNFCDQVTSLDGLGTGGNWYMLAAIEAHESLHEAAMPQIIKDASASIEAYIEDVYVDDSGLSQADAIEAIKASPAFLIAVELSNMAFLIQGAPVCETQHTSGATAAAERAVVDPMISSICTYSGWYGALCPACP
jgi:hypothetical protein